VGFDELKDLGVVTDRQGWQVINSGQDTIPMLHPSAGKLAYDERVNGHLHVLEQPDEDCIATTQVIDPDGRIDEDQPRLR
jgi:hypothetical protein